MKRNIFYSSKISVFRHLFCSNLIQQAKAALICLIFGIFYISSQKHEVFSRLQRLLRKSPYFSSLFWKSFTYWSCRLTSTRLTLKTYWWLDVLQQLNRAALTLEQRLGPVHDLPDNLLQVSLLLKQVIDDLQQRLSTSGREGHTNPETLHT